MEWAALDWNAAALEFYAGLGARPGSFLVHALTDLGAQPVEGWTIHRLEGDGLRRLALT